jgi:tripartite-type tricarboxylate transporter receptor subunit TctC
MSIARLAFAVATALVFAVHPGIAEAGYPERPVRLIMGAGPGGASDLIARLAATALTKKWGQSVLVESRPGADGMVATDYVANAAPDGYTLNFISSNHAITPHQYKTSYDPIKSFAPVVLLMKAPDFLLVNPKVLPVNSVAELIAYAKANPGKLNYAAPGKGSNPHIEMATFAKMTGLVMTGVNYRGGGAAMISVLGGETQLEFGSPASSLEQVKSGKLRALAVSMKHRNPLMPDLPTVAEAANLPGFDLYSWFGVLAPAGTPKDIVRQIRNDMVAVMESPEIKARLAEQGFITIYSTPDEFLDFLKTDIPAWGERLKAISGTAGDLKAGSSEAK